MIQPCVLEIINYKVLNLKCFLYGNKLFSQISLITKLGSTNFSAIDGNGGCKGVVDDISLESAAGSIFKEFLD
jgi:hypothetical protein